MSEEKQSKEQGGSRVSLSTAVVLRGSASCFKEQQDSVACGLAGTGGLLKLKILSSCMGKTSSGVTQGTALAVVVTLTKSPEIRQPGHRPDSPFGCPKAGHTVCHRGV